MSEKDKAMYFLMTGADGVSFKDVDNFVASIPQDDERIDLRLHCVGGSVSEGWAIVDKLRSTGKTISATIEGACASMASVILLAASDRKAPMKQIFHHTKQQIHVFVIVPGSTKRHDALLHGQIFHFQPPAIQIRAQAPDRHIHMV